MNVPIESTVRQHDDHWANRPTLDRLQQHDILHLRAAFMERLFPDVQGMKVLEVGSGPAHDSLVFACRGAEVTALDYSTIGVQLAREFYHQLRLPLETAVADARELPFEDHRFDLAFNAGVLEHFTDAELERVIDEMIRVVKPGGVVLAFCPNRYNVFYQHHLKKIRKHGYEFERAFTAAELKERFEARGLPQVHVSGVHVHPAPNYLLPTWLPKYHRIEPLCRQLFRPLERAAGLHGIKALIGQDFVAWAVAPQKLGTRRTIATLDGGPAVREKGKAA